MAAFILVCTFLAYLLYFLPFGSLILSPCPLHLAAPQSFSSIPHFPNWLRRAFSCWSLYTISMLCHSLQHSHINHSIFSSLYKFCLHFEATSFLLHWMILCSLFLLSPSLPLSNSHAFFFSALFTIASTNRFIDFLYFQCLNIYSLPDQNNVDRLSSYISKRYHFTFEEIKCVRICFIFRINWAVGASAVRVDFHARQSTQKPQSPRHCAFQVDHINYQSDHNVPTTTTTTPQQKESYAKYWTWNHGQFQHLRTNFHSKIYAFLTISKKRKIVYFIWSKYRLINYISMLDLMGYFALIFFSSAKLPAIIINVICCTGKMNREWKRGGSPHVGGVKDIKCNNTHIMWIDSINKFIEVQIFVVVIRFNSTSNSTHCSSRFNKNNKNNG